MVFVSIANLLSLEKSVNKSTKKYQINVNGYLIQEIARNAKIMRTNIIIYSQKYVPIDLVLDYVNQRI